MTMSTNEDIDDYMSDTFVTQDVNDIRPTLLFSHSSRVKHENMKKKLRSDPKPKGFYRDLEHRLREQALNTPLDETNKGFKMLAKMGFNVSTADTKTTETSGQTISDNKKAIVSEPIKIELKNDRKGLGSQPKANRTVVQKREPIDDKLIEEKFLTHKRSKNVLFLTEKDLKTAQTVCRNLDLESGLDELVFKTQTVRPKWFWPQIVAEEEADQQSDEEEVEECVESVEQKLKSINDYLRDNYFYCIWCGIRYNDSKDLCDNCLGNTRDDHQ